ncbi:DUF3857 domain-containing protein [Ferruginibacter sp.]
MKQYLLLSVIILLIPFISFAQDLSEFGIVSGDELNLKECSFDKDANAVILLNEAVSDHDDQYHLITNHHVRIKILKEKGFDEANISLRFWRKDDFEFINVLEAMVINTDDIGQLVKEKLPKKAFYTKDINERIGVVTFTFPNIRVGSIIEYSYRSIMKNYGGLDDWDFQKDLPVVKSKYILTVLPRAEFTYKLHKRDDLPANVKLDKDNGRVMFEMNNIPSLTDEPYMDAREDYVQKVVFQLSGYNNGMGRTNYMTSWDEVIRELLSAKEFGNQLGKNIAGTSAFTDEVKKMPVEEDKMKAVYNYVRNNMSWNDVYSKFAGDGVKDAWEKKKGTSGEINLILVNLLKEVDLETYPVLVSERFHGKVDVKTPFIDQFNSVFACVIIKERKYYLDATDLFTPAHIIPNDILNTNALIVNRKRGGIVNITNDSLQYSDFINVQDTVSSEGVLSGEAFVSSSGYSRIKKISSYKEEGKEQYIKRMYQKNGISVSDFQFMNQDNDSLNAEQRFDFRTNLSAAGDYLYVPLNLFTGFDKNPFINDNRFSNVNFGYIRNIHTYVSVALPANYNLDAMPKSIKMTTLDKDIVFSRSVTFDKANNTLTCMLEFDFKKSLYAVDEYDILKEVFKKLFDYLKEPVVLKKK